MGVVLPLLSNVSMLHRVESPQHGHKVATRRVGACFGYRPSAPSICGVTTALINESHIRSGALLD